ncbi:kelch-like protein 38 isoform X3 [Oryzias melastigma]|uniref:Kelch-like family member 38a n=1 Tax=Oryzias melastigma TaxID=30732 RepID=A0A3B3DFA6_ORYME|nr:kelch-like protein 38 isoform X3 [Oryzias melastigma]
MTDPQPRSDIDRMAVTPQKVFSFKDSELPCYLLGQLNTLRQERILTDVLLCSEHQEIPCHRSVLVSSSPYFRAMFCSNFLESSQARVNLKGISSNVLSGIVHYVYTGCIAITMEIVLPLMQAASMLHYGNLFEACSMFLQEQLSPENCLSMIRLSEILHCESLKERAKEMAVRCFSDVAASEDFCELSLPELMCYLEDDRLCAEEEQVFETLLAWIHHDPFSRRGAIHDLFKKVRLRYIHPTYLFQFIANDPLVQSSTLCTEIIESVRRLMLTASAKCSRELKPLWTTPRRYTCRETLVVVGGRKNNEQTSREALLYDERTHRWEWLAKLPLRLYKAAYVCIHSILYVLGGLSLCMGSGDSSVSATVYTLSLKTNQWRTAEPMLEPRYAHQSVSYLHFIFVLGGIGVNKRISPSVERYNSMFNNWETMAPMPTAALHPAVAASDQRIYVFGGEDAMQNPVRLIQVEKASLGRQTEKDLVKHQVWGIRSSAASLIVLTVDVCVGIQVYHISRNLWSKLETRTVKNVCAPAAVIEEKIYIVGGYTKRMIAYDTKANKFVKCENLRERRMHHSATVINNKLYVTGGRILNGHDTIEDSDCFECYDPKTDSWTSKGSLPYKLFDHGSLPLVCVSNKPNPP